MSLLKRLLCYVVATGLVLLFINVGITLTHALLMIIIMILIDSYNTKGDI